MPSTAQPISRIWKGGWFRLAARTGTALPTRTPEVRWRKRPLLGARSRSWSQATLCVRFIKGRMRLQSQGGRRIAFSFRCDAPDVERRMKMAIGPLRLRERIVGVLYQSTILSERARPPIRFLDVSAALEQYKEDVAPLIVSCSFCSKIDWPSGRDAPWAEPEDYYRLGGLSEVRISHGVCPDCAEYISESIS